MKKFIILNGFLVASSLLFSQNKHRADKWLFGIHIGLDFTGGAPVVIPADSMYTPEGCSTISDTSGNLLFYTNSVTIWDKNNNPMPNGKNLKGGTSATQAALIVPMPASTTKYYVFTLDEDAGANGCRFSIVDLSLNGGLGDVTIKDSLLLSPVPEKLTAVKDPQNNRYWMLIHGWGSNTFYAYELNASGLQAPVTSNAGIVHGGSFQNGFGQMKFNLCGNKLAVACGYLNKVELLDFSTSTGIVSNAMTIPFSFHVYGVEFSQDQNKLYVSNYNPNATLEQFDISSGVLSTIQASAIILSTTPDIYGLQLANDGKIYACVSYNAYLAVINYPDSLGTSCNYIDQGIYVDPTFMGNTTALSLPGFVQSYFLTEGTACPSNTSVNSFTESDLSIYPNPSSTIFSLSALPDGFSAEVYDSKGNLIEKFISDPAKKTAFGKNYPDGIYLVKISSGQQNKTFKLLKTGE